MLIIARNKLKFLQAGRELTIAHRNPTRYQHGRNYALGLDHRRSSAASRSSRSKPPALRVRLARHYEPIRLLAARSQYGYVDNPAQALRDEPEAISPQDLNHLASQAHARYAQQRADELAAQQARSLGIRVKEAAGRGDLIECKALGAQLAALSAGTADISYRQAG